MTFFELEFALEPEYGASNPVTNVQASDGTRLVFLLNAAMDAGVQTIGESSTLALIDHVETQVRADVFNTSALVPCVSCNRL